MTNDHQENKVAKAKLGKDMQTLKTLESFKILMSKLDNELAIAKDAVITADSWEDVLQKRAYLNGLQALDRVVDTLINQGKGATRSLTTEYIRK